MSMKITNLVQAVVCVAAVAMFTSAAIGATGRHEQTFTGTVISVEGMTLKVNVVDPETKKTDVRTFVADEETKVTRDNKHTTFVMALITKDEAISVTVDHDLDEELAMSIKLGPSR